MQNPTVHISEEKEDAKANEGLVMVEDEEIGVNKQKNHMVKICMFHLSIIIVF